MDFCLTVKGYREQQHKNWILDLHLALLLTVSYPWRITTSSLICLKLPPRGHPFWNAWLTHSGLVHGALVIFFNLAVLYGDGLRWTQIFLAARKPIHCQDSMAEEEFFTDLLTWKSIVCKTVGWGRQTIRSSWYFQKSVSQRIPATLLVTQTVVGGKSLHCAAIPSSAWDCRVGGDLLMEKNRGRMHIMNDDGVQYGF